MRKLFALLLAGLLLFSAVACTEVVEVVSGTPSDSSDSSSPVDSDPSSATSDTPSGGVTDKTTAKPDGDTQGTTAKPDGNTDNTTAKPNGDTQSTTTKTNKPTTTTTKWPQFVGGIEQPVTINTAVLYNKQSSSFDATAETRRQSILNAKDTVKAGSGGTTYYVSPKGDDNNNGLSKSTPWRSGKRLNAATFKAGDLILFERGGVWRDVRFYVPNGVSLGAYGSGPKPQLLGSDKNYADAKLWTKTQYTNIWSIKLDDSDANARMCGPFEDVGNIVFDYGKVCASTNLKLTKGGVKKDFDYYYDKDANLLYMYYSKGNPAEDYDSIEICTYEAVMRLAGTNHTIENLCVKYTGVHAISAGVSSGITIRGCEIGYIGGSFLDSKTRYGNGIEFYGACKNNLVENNWVYQCYDAGYTNQGPGWHENIVVRGNLLEYSPYNIEIFTTKEMNTGGLRNCTYEDNYVRFAGFGFGTKNRIGGTTRFVANVNMYDYISHCENTVFSNNVFDSSWRFQFSHAYPNDSQKRGPTITGNTWIQGVYKTDDTEASVGRNMLTGRDYVVTSKASLEEGVRAYDKNRKKIVFEG